MLDGWYYAEGEKAIGPITLDALAAHLRTKSEAETTKVWHPSLSNWQAAKDVPQISERMFRSTLLPEVPLKIAPPPLVERPQSKNVDSNARTRGRVAFFVTLIAVFIVGAILSTLIYGNSSDGVAYLAGQFLAPLAIGSLLAWSFWPRSPYLTGTVTLLVAASSVGITNLPKVLDSLAAIESKAALRDVSDPSQIEDAIRGFHPILSCNYFR